MIRLPLTAPVAVAPGLAHGSVKWWMPLLHGSPMALRHRCRIEVQRLGVGRVRCWYARAQAGGVLGKRRHFWAMSKMVVEARAQRWCLRYWASRRLPPVWVSPGAHVGTQGKYEYYLDATHLLVDDEGEPFDGPNDGPRLEYYGPKHAASAARRDSPALGAG